MIKKTFCIALCALATFAASAALFDSNPSGNTGNGAVAGTLNERGNSRSKIFTTNNGVSYLATGGITNQVNAVMTNEIFEIPFNVPVAFEIVLSAISPAGLAGPTNYVTTAFFDLSARGTNAADFTTTAPLLARWSYSTNSGPSYTLIVLATNFPASQLGGFRYIRFSSLSNDASTIASGSTNGITLFPTNANFNARFAAP